jgi:hypothetical protein
LDDARKKREEIVKRDSAAQVQFLEGDLKQTLDLYKDTYEKLKATFNDTGDQQSFMQATDTSFTSLKENLDDLIDKLEAAENKAAKIAGKTAQEMVVLQQSQHQRINDITKTTQDVQSDRGKTVTDYQDKSAEDDASKAKLKMDRMLEIYRAGYDRRRAIQEAYYASGVTNETQYVQEIGRIAYEALMDEIRLNQQLVDTTKLTADQRAEIEQKLAILKNQLGTQIIQNATAVGAAEKKASENAAKTAEDEAKAFRELAAAKWEAAMATAEYTAQQRDMIESLRATQPLEDAFKEAGDMISGALESWTQGLGSLVEAWVLYGEAGPDAMRKMTAQVLASLAAQAAAKALFYTAEGIVALFLDPPLAGAFFSAAAIMAGIAGGAALAGRAVAGNSFKKDKSSGGKFSTGNTRAAGSGQSEDLKPYSRSSDDAFVSGRRDEPARFVADAVRELTKKIDSMRPGDVLVAGTREKPGHIGQQVAKDIDRDAGIGKRILQKSGVR